MKEFFPPTYIWAAVFQNPPKGDRREVVPVFRKSEFVRWWWWVGGGFGRIYPKKGKNANRLKTRNRRAAGIP